MKIVDEPVDEWVNGGFLQGMNHGTVNMCAFQHMALVSIASDLVQAMRSNPRLIIVERSAWSNLHTFAKANLDGLNLDMYTYSWNKIVQSFIDDSVDVHHIWLKTSTSVARERIKERARDSEDGIAIDYLEKLETLHAQWFATFDGKVIDAVKSRDAVFSDVVDAIVSITKSWPDDKRANEIEQSLRA